MGVRLGGRSPERDAVPRSKLDTLSQLRGFRDAKRAAAVSVAVREGRDYDYEVIYECARRGVNLELG